MREMGYHKRPEGFHHNDADGGRYRPAKRDNPQLLL
jgi:hypothetical protein